MPGHDPGAKLARWRDQIASAATPADRVVAALNAVRAVAMLIQAGDSAQADALRDQAADLLADLFETAAARLEASNTGRPAGAGAMTSGRSVPR
jgi:hypothetical protein